MEIKVLFLGDIVSRLGRKSVKKYVPKLKKEKDIDLVVANCENATNGRGITLDHYKELISYGVDAFTSGEHIYRQKEIKNELENLDIAVPLNFYPNLPGKRYLDIDLGKKGIVRVINLIGTNQMGGRVNNPFQAIEKHLQELNKNLSGIIVDFHAEYTSEKQVMGYFLDGKVSAVAGTHTHVQTADEQILSKGTAYITDLGMCGSTNSVLGVKTKIILNRLSKGEEQRFEWVKEGSFALNGAIISIDTENQLAKNINRISFITNQRG